MIGGIYDLESAERRPRSRLPGKYIVFGSLAIAAGAAGLAGALRTSEPQGAAAAAETTTLEARRELALSDFLLDLAPDPDGRNAYIKLSAVVAFGNNDDEAANRAALSRAAIEERIAFMLRGLTPGDFEGEEGLQRVKLEMLRRVNLVIAPDAAKEVLITDLVIQ